MKHYAVIETLLVGPDMRSMALVFSRLGTPLSVGQHVWRSGTRITSEALREGMRLTLHEQRRKPVRGFPQLAVQGAFEDPWPPLVIYRFGDKD